MRVRKQAYRKTWISHSDRQRFASVWAADFAQARAEWEKGVFSSPELCARLIDRVWRDLFPGSWGNGKTSEFGEVGLTPSLALFLSQRYRGLPVSVPRSLAAWARGEYLLSLHFQNLTVDEVLALQARGQRCVSLMIEPDEILNFEHEGRDFISFLIHDLIHSDHLMSNDLSYRRQTNFAKWMFEIWKYEAQWRSELSAAHAERLEYIAADMNSHLVHLLKTLKALIAEISAEYGSHLEEIAQRAWSRLYPHESKFWGSWELLNTASESGDTHLHLTQIWDQLPAPATEGVEDLSDRKRHSVDDVSSRSLRTGLSGH